MAEQTKRVVKVAKFRILKPTAGMTWKELGKLLEDVRYRVFRLANMAVSEAYMGFHAWRTGQTDNFKVRKASELSRMLRAMLAEEGVGEEKLNRFSRTGAVPDGVSGALYQYKIRAATRGAKWSEVVRGKVSLPTFRGSMATPVRCDKSGQRRLERGESGEVELDLMLTMKPYARVVLGTRDIGEGQEAVLERLLANAGQSMEGYRQRCFEIKQDPVTRKWFLFVTYDFPAKAEDARKDIVVGVDVGVSVPLYAAVNNGLARLGGRFRPLGRAIRQLQRQVQARRRSIQRGGSSDFGKQTARAGHGRVRRLLPIKALEGRIEKAYSTLNHQLSAAVVDFARSQGAGVIQMEDLAGLRDELRGTYIGANWRYHQLQGYIEYKGKETGIEVRKVNPRNTSRRCSKCGYINTGFTREYRDSRRVEGKVARYECVNPASQDECNKKPFDPDYNAARNIATLDIEDRIRVQCKKQGIEI